MSVVNKGMWLINALTRIIKLVVKVNRSKFKLKVYVNNLTRMENVLME